MVVKISNVAIGAACRLTLCVGLAACGGTKSGTQPSGLGAGGAMNTSGNVIGAAASGASGASSVSPNSGAGTAGSQHQTGTGGQPAAPVSAGSKVVGAAASADSGQSGGATMASNDLSKDAGSPSDGGTPGGTVQPILPKAPANCPMLTTGFATIMSHDTPVQVQVWAGTKGSTPAPMVVYWHVTGGVSSEAVGGIGLPLAVAQEIQDAGGLIVSPQNTTGAGNNTGNAVWYTGDFDVADQLVACAFQQYNLDPRRIYTAGGSAGALQAGTMVYERSNYIAASLPNSGGYATGGRRFQNPNHIPALMTMHGAQGLDVVIVDFSQQSLFLAGDVAKHGGFAIDCNHGGGHVGAPDDLKTAGWEFFKDHPFGVTPEPYAKGLPADFPPYCKIITPADAIPNPDPIDMPDASYE
jgi:hypothetical protein